MIQRLFFVLLAWATITFPARASVGIVVRLVTNGQEVTKPVEIILANEMNDQVVLGLKDDGTPPDVTKDDGGYSGAMIIEGNDFTVFIKVPSGEPMELGDVSWSDGTTARDLVITMGNGIVTLETGSGLDVASSRGNAQTAPSSDPEGGGSLGGPPNQAPMNQTSSAPIRPATGAPMGTAPGLLQTPRGETPANDATLYIIGGFLLLTLAIVGFTWFRPIAETGRGHASNRFQAVPEPGLLGDGTPSVSDGLSTWITPSDHASGFFQLLLQSLAQYHRVLIVADDELEVPMVHGGPLFRAARSQPVHVAEAVEDLVDGGGHPLAVLVQLPQIGADELRDLVELLPQGIGIVVLTAAVVGEHEPSVRIARSLDGWSLQCAEGTIHLRETEWGIRVDSPTPSA